MKSQATPATPGGSRKSHRIRTLAASLGLVAVMGAAACATQVESNEPADEAKPQQIEQDAKKFHGPVGVVVDAALTQGNLTAEQADAIRAIGEEMRFDREDKREMREKFKGSAVEIVRTGTADTAQFDEAVDQMTQAMEQHMEQTADALEEIQLLLEPAQRTAVAAELRARIIEKFGAPVDEARQRTSFKRIAAHLMLSTVQLDKLKMIRDRLMKEDRPLHPTREELLALVDAFEGNDFRAAVDAFHADKLELMRERFAHAGENTDAVLTILTPGQRDLLADLIDRGPREVLLGEQAAQLEQRQ